LVIAANGQRPAHVLGDARGRPLSIGFSGVATVPGRNELLAESAKLGLQPCRIQRRCGCALS